MAATSGVYVNPFVRRQLEEEAAARNANSSTVAAGAAEQGTAAESSSEELQFELDYWDALKRTLMGLVNRTTVDTVAFICVDCLQENVILGRGLLCRALMRAQNHSPELTPVLAALAAAINAKVPVVGELLVKRLVFQFKRCFKRLDVAGMSSAAQFIGHLAAQRVASDLCVLKILAALLSAAEIPSREEILVASDVFKVCFRFLQERMPAAFNVVLDPIRDLVGSRRLDLQSESVLEAVLKEVRLWQTQRDDAPLLPPELDLVPPEEQTTHAIDLDDDIDPERGLDNFRHDPDFIAHLEEYDNFKTNVLGLSDEEVVLPPPVPTQVETTTQAASAPAPASDLSSEQLDALRREVFLTVKSSIRRDEVVHKLLKRIPQGRESLVINMIVEATLREKTYDATWGDIAELLCRSNGRYQAHFEQLFADVYRNIDNLDTRQVEIYARFFARLLRQYALSWRVMSNVRLTEHDTSEYSRRFIKVLLEELGEHMTVQGLKDAMNNLEMRGNVAGFFPRDSLENATFAVNFFEVISASGATVDLRPVIGPLRAWVEVQQQPSMHKRPRD
jgi:pre-mRNA-splicing factor CWC22